jgi:hypothetical protein
MLDPKRRISADDPRQVTIFGSAYVKSASQAIIKPACPLHSGPYASADEYMESLTGPVDSLCVGGPLTQGRGRVMREMAHIKPNDRAGPPSFA